MFDSHETAIQVWKRANPWVLQNMQNSLAACGRYATREEAVEEATRRGGVVSVEGHRVLFSEVPLL
jgi:hypothetical protein